jgi:predicted PurR-regulated permease PerM
MPSTADALQRILCIPFVKNSSLLSDTLKEQDYMTETLQKIEENRDENLKLLKQKKSLIIKQISAAKSKVLKYLDETAYNIMLTTEIINLDVCVYFTVYFRRWWYS